MRSVNSDEERIVELERLETMRRTFEPLALEGSTQAGWLLIKIHESKAALLGLKLKANPNDDSANDLASELDEIRARRNARRSGDA